MQELSKTIQSEFEKGSMLYKHANRLIVEQDDVSYRTVVVRVSTVALCLVYRGGLVLSSGAVCSSHITVAQGPHEEHSEGCEESCG